MDIEQLNIEYGIEGQVKFVNGNGDFPFILISNRSATALISVYAAQVLSFQPAEEYEDLLFLSQKSYYDEGKAIRGGIPVCWPWFGSDPADLKRPNHGFVRNGLWTVSGTETETETDYETKVKLRFPENVQSESCWQHAFALELVISVGNTLTLELITRNTGDQIFSITQAFHTYFHVGNINQVQILGLEDTEYLDKLDNGAPKHQMGAVTVFDEVDRIYTDVNNELIIDDSAFDRRIRISSIGGKTAVVWNPWMETSAKMADLEDDDYKRFVCVEVGNIAGDAVQLTPGSNYSLLTNIQIIRD
jgi:glucose-6-phosphate 1-epimerase